MPDKQYVRLLLDDRDEGCHSACGVRASFEDGIFPLRCAPANS